MSFGDLGRINTNLQSKQALFSLNRINRNVAQSQLRLATGQRINRAEDDAAGFSIGAKLQSRIAGLEQALQNAGDAKSVLDIAEASLGSVTDILTTIKVKATQAASDSVGSEERDFLQAQVAALLTDIDSLVGQTTFQGLPLLDGNYDATFQVGEGTGDTISVEIQQDGGDGFTAAELGIGAIDISTQAGASAAMDLVDDAITAVSSGISSLGISQTRLSIREEFISRSIITNQAVRSRIVDTDFAKEASNLIRNQILQQTAVAAVAQANAAPAAILQLIGLENRFGFNGGFFR